MAIKIELKGNVLKAAQQMTGSKLDQVMRKVAVDMKSTVQMRFRNGRDPNNKMWGKPKYRSGKPLLDTENLSRSFSTRYNNTTAIVGTNLVYARIHNYGGKITPKNAKWLTIPIHADAKDKRAREFEKGFVFKSRSGNLYIAELDGHKRLRLLYALKKEIKIQARPFIGINKEMINKYNKWFIEEFGGKVNGES